MFKFIIIKFVRVLVDENVSAANGNIWSDLIFFRIQIRQVPGFWLSAVSKRNQ